MDSAIASCATSSEPACWSTSSTSVRSLLEERPADAPLADWEAIRAELANYDADLATRIEIVALNKLDLLPDDARETRLAPLEAALRASRPRGDPHFGRNGRGHRRADPRDRPRARGRRDAEHFAEAETAP